MGSYQLPVQAQRVAMSNDTRPRVGWVTRPDGSRFEVRFIPSGNPGSFLAVTLDGDRVILGPDDTIRADVLAPGQTITVSMGFR